MLSVPRVTMKGGSLIRVTSRPFSAPASTATARPMISATGPGIPLSATSFAITRDDSTMTAPMDRSIPAVRITRVWPTASEPPQATCCRRMDRFCGVKNRPFSRPKMTPARIKTISGLSAGIRCRMSCSRRPAVSLGLRSSLVVPGSSNSCVIDGVPSSLA